MYINSYNNSNNYSGTHVTLIFSEFHVILSFYSFQERHGVLGPQGETGQHGIQIKQG